MNGTIEQLHFSASPTGCLNERTDEELLLEYRASGDSEAFEELVHRYEKELFGYLRRYLGNAEAAEDVFQQTFLQVHLKCEQFEPGRPVRPWLYTVATNQAIDFQRRNRRHRMVSLDRQLGGNANRETGAWVEMIESQELGPDEDAELHEMRNRVRCAVDSLPEQVRQVVMLVYFQGLKYREAADVLDIPVGTVKSRLHAAIGKLHETATRTHLPK